MSDPRHLLVIGGRRSGKSRYAEGMVLASGRRPVYVATAEPRDPEMSERIAAHRARRSANWKTLEEPLALPEVIVRAAGPEEMLLVDCLTLWLSNLMEAGRPVETATEALLDALNTAAGPVVVVSNEVGSGIVPMDPLARRFADAQGMLNQRVAAHVARVVLMTAGLPLQVKPAPAPENFP